MQSIICFVSDFGTGDTWVGVCHAVVHRACPQARVVDMDHSVPAYDIRKGAVITAASVYQIPDAIHLSVVDPGVGSGRRDLCIRTAGGAVLVGPDNGILIPAATRAGGLVEAWAIDQAKIDVRSPLPTFHARDVLAPAAAAIACGVAPESLGDPVELDSLVPGPFEFGRRDGSAVVAEVLDVDRFGSLRFNVPVESMDAMGLQVSALDITLGHNSITVPVGKTYADVDEGDPVALVDSSGWLTLAVNQGEAADRYGIQPGTTARIRVHD